MLYDELTVVSKYSVGEKFKEKADGKVEILKNLNPTLVMRPYQREALGRFFFYCEDFPTGQRPIHLLFNMATGSGKTLIMAANILYLYTKGYRNFIFFTRLGNIIQKTKANFLDPHSSKYLFADKIVIDNKEIKVRDVENFEGSNGDDINIIFSTTALLHSRFTYPRENVMTYEDLKDKKIVLLADEAHNLNAETNEKHSKAEEEDKHNWESTVINILHANSHKQNILLEFTATARLEQEYREVLEKYKDKAIFRYDLKEYRLDGYSKEVRTLQINAPVMERALSAIIISQYRRKVAEKHNISLKPVVLFKSNRVTAPKVVEPLEGKNPTVVVSSEFKHAFHQLISDLNEKMIEQQTKIQNETLNKAFQFFKLHGISHYDLVNELKTDFSPESCLTVDDDKDVEEKQILLNTLEDPNNEIRAVFATEKLNEGWDVLNLFDIVRLYNSRDARANKPGKTTVQEAQLIGRGARYYPFIIGEHTDLYRRKFDADTSNELRILEKLYYHSVTNPKYIQELEGVLVREGIIPSKTVEREVKIKPEFKLTGFWKDGLIFLNSQKIDTGEKVFNLADAKAEFNHNDEKNIYALPTREALEKDIFDETDFVGVKVNTEIKEFKLLDFGVHVLRIALSKIPIGKFNVLNKVFGNIESVSQFITDPNYLGGIKIKVKGTPEQLSNLLQIEKLSVALFVLDKVLENARKEKKQYYGSKEFKAQLLNEVFQKDKVIQLDGESNRAQPMKDFDFLAKPWFAQNEIWGTSEEETFLRFIDEMMSNLETKYQEVALIRNEFVFKIYSFDEGQPFYPDFVLFLKEKETNNEHVYQVFIEPKGDEFLDAQKTFEQSKEGWKQNFLQQIEKEHKVDFRLENRDFKLIGLPFFNEGNVNPDLRESFERTFEGQLSLTE